MLTVAATLSLSTGAAENGSSLHGNSAVDELQSVVKQWIALEKERHAAVRDWKQQRELLRSEHELLQQRADELSKHVETSREKADDTRSTLEDIQSERQAAKRNLDTLTDALSWAEANLLQLFPRLPPPLRRGLAADMTKLRQSPAEPQNRLRTRTRRLFRIFKEIQAFDADVHAERAILRTPAGQQREMLTLYLGLSCGFAASPTANVAARGAPHTDGWKWTWDPAWTDAVRKAHAVCTGEASATLTELPLAVTEN